LLSKSEFSRRPAVYLDAPGVLHIQRAGCESYETLVNHDIGSLI